MEVELIVPFGVVNTPAGDFNFDSNSSSPYITAPSSPQRFGNFFFSAPTSPTRFSSSFSNNQFSDLDSSLLREQNPNAAPHHSPNHDDFEFNFSGLLERASLSAADELFDGGKIRPLKPQSFDGADSSSAPSQEKKISSQISSSGFEGEKQGRERVSSSSGRKGSRSLSPLRVSDIVCESEEKVVSSPTSNNVKSFLSSIPFTKGYRKWRFRDFLLFRSASEGRATDKDPLRKYVVLSKKAAGEEDVKNSSFRSSESSGSVSRRRGPVSAHEIHYTVNRAASEEMKKKTFLPYKQGLLGCLGFTSGSGSSIHHISRGVGSFTRS